MRLRDLESAAMKSYHLIDAECFGVKEKIILCHDMKRIDSIRSRYPELKIYFIPEITEEGGGK